MLVPDSPSPRNSPDLLFSNGSRQEVVLLDSPHFPVDETCSGDTITLPGDDEFTDELLPTSLGAAKTTQERQRANSAHGSDGSPKGSNSSQPTTDRNITVSATPQIVTEGSVASNEDPDTAKGAQSPTDKPTSVAYQYSAPVTSPFYRHVLSPLCDWICHNMVPKCITPDQISYISLTCAIVATIVSFWNLQLVVVVLWLLYGLLDNIDGKQARRLKMSTAGGEFLDHSCDSIVTSLSALVWINALVPERIIPTSSYSTILWNSTPIGLCTGIIPIVASVSGQFPFFLSCCASHVIGRVLLGGAMIGSSKDYITVDEYNTIFLPSICLVRHFAPGLWDTVLIDTHYNIIDGTITLGVALAIFMFVIAFLCCTICFCQLVDKANTSHLPLFVPGVAYLAIVWTFRPSFLLCIAPFACLCMELLLGKLRAETRFLRFRIWWPILWLIIVSIRFRSNGHHTFLVFQYCACICLLLWYKNKINTAAAQRNAAEKLAGPNNNVPLAPLPYHHSTPT